MDGVEPPGTERRRTVLADRRLSDRRALDSDAEGAPAGAEGRHRHPRRAREQPEEHRRQDSARRADRGHRRQRIGQVDARQRHPVQVARADALQGRRRARRARSHRGHRAHRQGDRDRSVADRPDAAIEPGDLHRPVHLHPRSVRDDAGREGARVQAGPLLVQRQGRPLRGVPGRRRDRHRDALPARRLRHLRAVQGAPLQPRDARDQVPRQVDRRRARADRRPGAAAARELPGDRQQAAHAAGASASATSSSASRRRRCRAARRSG